MHPLLCYHECLALHQQAQQVSSSNCKDPAITTERLHEIRHALVQRMDTATRAA